VAWQLTAAAAGLAVITLKEITVGTNNREATPRRARRTRCRGRLMAKDLPIAVS
jgi:hypothetical protein